jgi:hypothetical protein
MTKPPGTVVANAGEPEEPAAPEPVFTASHEVLFEVVEADACDACGAPLAGSEDEDGYQLAGSGVYMWTRGDSVRLEKAPLCASCAAAIGMTALARWEIEEEEG